MESATDLLVSGNTATNVSTGEGGGIFLSGTSTLSATNLTVSNNTSGNNGGGLRATGTGTNMTLTNLLVSRNTASNSDGGGIHIDVATLTVNNGTIAANQCYDDGGGLRIETSGTTANLRNCIFWNNAVGLPTASGSPTGKQISMTTGTSVTINNCNLPTLTVSTTGNNQEIYTTGATTTLTVEPATSPPTRSSATVSPGIIA